MEDKRGKIEQGDLFTGMMTVFLDNSVVSLPSENLVNQQQYFIPEVGNNSEEFKRVS